MAWTAEVAAGICAPRGPGADCLVSTKVPEFDREALAGKEVVPAGRACRAAPPGHGVLRVFGRPGWPTALAGVALRVVVPGAQWSG